MSKVETGRVYTMSRADVVALIRRRITIIAFAHKFCEQKEKEAIASGNIAEANKYNFLVKRCRMWWGNLNELMDFSFDSLEKGRYVIKPVVAEVTTTEDDDSFTETKFSKDKKPEKVIRDIGALRQLLFLASTNREWDQYKPTLIQFQREAKSAKGAAETFLETNKLIEFKWIIQKVA